MIVFAKKSYQTRALDVVDWIAQELHGTAPVTLERARLLLVGAGQLEQGVLDAGHPRGRSATRLTRAAARLFLAAREGEVSRAAPAYRALRCALAETGRELGEARCEIRVPEGFAWYALYPDSYAQTAETWAARRKANVCPVSVLGLRSIGTTLAAVVAEALICRGYTIASLASVRPEGPAFSRRVRLPADFVPGDRAIIVDEGPGLSGSSMAAAGDALSAIGVQRQCIYFFAGRSTGPGNAGGKHVRGWWSLSRVLSTPLEATLVCGATIPDALASHAEHHLGATEGPAQPFGAGAWRQKSGHAKLPRAAAPFLETPKMLVQAKDGSALLYKFSGFALAGVQRVLPNGHALQRVSRLAESRLTIAPLGSIHGWLAFPWMEGKRLVRRDGSGDFVETTLAGVIGTTAGDGMEPLEACAAVTRIEDALMATSRARLRQQSLIERAAEAERERVVRSVEPVYADGRLAPHEWIRLPDGRILKTDACGHDCDHTWVGRQSLAWDIAGAEIDWQLDDAGSAALREAVGRRVGVHYSDATIAFYRAGYSAFRAALSAHSAVQARARGGDARPFVSARLWYEAMLARSIARLRDTRS